MELPSASHQRTKKNKKLDNKILLPARRKIFRFQSNFSPLDYEPQPLLTTSLLLAVIDNR